MSVEAPRLPCFLVEWYRPQLTGRPIEDPAARLEMATPTVRDEGASVRLLMTLAVPAEEVLFAVSPPTRPMRFQKCVYGRASRSNGLPIPWRRGWPANHRETPDASANPLFIASNGSRLRL
jgi:hypothetical protein